MTYFSGHVHFKYEFKGEGSRGIFLKVGLILKKSCFIEETTEVAQYVI